MATNNNNELSKQIEKLTEAINSLNSNFEEEDKEKKSNTRTQEKKKNGKSDADEELNKFGQAMERFGKSFKTITSLLSWGVSIFDKTVNLVNDTWGKADHGASEYAKSIGASAASMKDLRDRTIEVGYQSKMGIKYNTSMEESLKMQMDYAGSIGRNIQFTNEQMVKMAALKAVIGQEQAVKFTANFEKFGLDSEAAIREVEDMMAGATKKGLSFKKISDDFLNNIDLAQRFTFKNGIDGLAAMAEKSAAIRWDMSQTAAFANKVGTLEGAVKSGAQLSVLGSSFTSMSNPIQMLYEGLNDMEGLNDRMTKMFANMAHYNKETKQVEVSAFNRLRIKAAAEAMGIDYGKAMESVYTQGRRGEIDNQLKGVRGLSEDQMEMVRNKALIDRKNGMAYLTINGKKKYVKHLTGADGNAIDAMGNTESKNIEDIAVNLRSMKDVVEGKTKDKDNMVAKGLKDSGVGEGVKEITAATSRMMNILSMVSAAMTAIVGTVGGIWATLKMQSWMRGRGGGGIGGGATSRVGGGAGVRGGGSAGAVGTPGGTSAGAASSAKPSIVSTSKNGWVTMSDGKKIRGMNNAKQYIRNNTPKTDWGARRDALIKQKRQNIARGTAGAVGGGMMVLGTLGAMGTGMMAERHRAKGTDEGDLAAANWDIGTSALGGMSTGAMIGSMFGPWGTLIGGAVGAIGGAVGGFIKKGEKKREIERRKENEARATALRDRLAARGVHLNGEDYTLDELNAIEGNYFADRSLREKMEINGDSQYIRHYARGGLISGLPHAMGGVKLEAEGGEFIVNKEATAEHFDELERINNSSLYGSEVKKFKNGGLVTSEIKSNEPMGKQLKVAENTNGGSNVSAEVGKVEVAPINLNIDGTIKLDGKNGSKDIDARELLSNPEFIRNLKDILTKEINLIEHKRFDKANYWRKL